MDKGSKGCGCGCAVMLVLLAVFASNASDSLLKCGLVVFIAVSIVVVLFKAGRKYASAEDTTEVEGQYGEYPPEDNDKPSEDDSIDDQADVESWYAGVATAQRKKQQDKFLRYLFSMLSKMAKANGRIQEEEVAAAQKAFDHFKFAQRRRKFCSRVFNEAKDNSRTIYWYAVQFGKLVNDSETCLFVYSLLWDIACADGSLDPYEEDILREICEPLHIPDFSFESQYRIHEPDLSTNDDTKTQEEQVPPNDAKADAEYEYERTYESGASPIWKAYDVIESDPSATIDELKSAYRRIAKLHHPDLLRAGGATEREISFATARMAEINSAWEDICKSRGIA